MNTHSYLVFIEHGYRWGAGVAVRTCQRTQTAAGVRWYLQAAFRAQCNPSFGLYGTAVGSELCWTLSQSVWRLETTRCSPTCCYVLRFNSLVWTVLIFLVRHRLGRLSPRAFSRLPERRPITPPPGWIGRLIGRSSGEAGLQFDMWLAGCVVAHVAHGCSINSRAWGSSTVRRHQQLATRSG